MGTLPRRADGLTSRLWLMPVLLLVATAPVWADSVTWLAGAASTSVSPANGAFLAGYDRNRRSTGVLDPLMARAVVVDDGHQPIVILTLDNIGLTRPDVERIQDEIRGRLAGVPAHHVVVSSTHTHAGPDVVGLWGERFWTSGRDPDYLDALTSNAADAAERAWDRRRPALLRVASEEVPMDWVENVSEPGLLDRTLTVLQFTGEDGRSIATLTAYACHPTVLGPENTRTSADYVHGFVSAMAAQHPGEHLFLQGAIGGWVQPLQGDRSHDLATALGGRLAEAVLRLLPSAETATAERLRFASTEVQIPLANWGFRLLSWLGVLERDLAGGAMRTTVARFNIGPVAFVTHPGETSPAYALESRQIMGGRYTVVMGLSQDAIGYILKPDYFRHPDRYAQAEYLTSVSVGPEAGPRIMEAVRRLVPE